MIASGPVGFFGKIPAHGDFVRLNVGDPLAQRFTRWLEEGSEACHRARAELPRDPVRFLFRAPGEARVLVGALRGSRDRVGRHFPLATFVPADGEPGGAAFPAALLVYGRFLDASAALLAGDRSSPGELAERAAALPLPGAAELAAAQEEARAAGARPAAELLQRLFGDAASGQRHYALHTFRAACATVRAREPSRAEVVLDCPAADASDAWAWLELARVALGWGVSPPFFLRPGAPGRLLVSLGAPPAAVLPALCEPPRDSPRIWPLATSSAAAVESARSALGAERLAALDGGRATVSELAVALAGGR